MEDIDQRAKADWKAETTSRERVKQIIRQTVEPSKASEVAERALVSEPTAREYLRELVEGGQAVSTEDGRSTLYKRSEQHLVDERINQLRTQHSHQELIDGIRDMKKEIREYRDKYGVESPEDLALELGAEGDGWGDLGRWKATRENLAIAKAALQVDEAHRIAEA